MSVRSVFITGANRGLGLEFVKQFLALSNPPRLIFASCRNPSKADELSQLANDNQNVKILTLDIKDATSFPLLRQEIEKEVGELGLNLLINNAGILHRDSLGNISKANMMENFEVNVVSPLLLTQELLPLLKRAAQSVNTKDMSCTRAGIVNITSKMGSVDDNTSGACYPYRASKTALNMVSKSLAVDLKSDGIMVLILHPGWVLTDMGGQNALITTEQSVSSMVTTILNAKQDASGTFLNYDGKQIAW